jgi:hypothetical protein
MSDDKNGMVILAQKCDESLRREGASAETLM